MRYVLLLFALILATGAAAQDIPVADATRVDKRIKEISKFGALPGGGVNRIAFSEADIEARLYVVSLMKKAGLEVTIDEAGNIIGHRKGKDIGKPVIAFGSHIDSVPEGGNFDGVAGVLSALECIELLNDMGITTDHPLEVIVFTNEEGGLIGSMAMNGTITGKDLQRISNSGKTMEQGIKDLGGDPGNISSAVREPGEIAAFLELHIEQGAVLDNEKIQIGVVEGIVGIETWLVTLEGKANHAGTTPMNMRHDALLAASKLVVEVNEAVRSFEGSQVGTVGKIKAEPGASNVVPGLVTLTIELRDLSREKIMRVFAAIEQKMKEIEKETGTMISYEHDHSNIPAPMDKTIRQFITEAAQELGFTYKNMPSGAGHDAQDMARIAPTGMIFVPSRDGISHSPKEFTTAQQVADGASVMLRTILKIDKSR